MTLTTTSRACARTKSRLGHKASSIPQAQQYKYNKINWETRITGAGVAEGFNGAVKAAVCLREISVFFFCSSFGLGEGKGKGGDYEGVSFPGGYEGGENGGGGVGAVLLLLKCH